MDKDSQKHAVESLFSFCGDLADFNGDLANFLHRGSVSGEGFF